MKSVRWLPRTALFALSIAVAALAPATSRGDGNPIEEDRRRLRQEKREEQERMRRREDEAKARIRQGRNQGERDLADVAPSVQRCRDALSFATQTAKAWSEQHSQTVPSELMSQGKKYRDRVAAIEKSYQDCGSALRSQTYVVNDVLNRIATLKTNAESAARDGDRFCFSVLGLYADEGREGLRSVDDELKASSDSIDRMRNAVRQMAIRDRKAVNEQTRKKVAKELGRTERLWESEAETARRRKRDYEESQKIAQAQWDADEARRQLENSLSELEQNHSDLSRRRDQCESRLASAASPHQYGYSSDDNATSVWDAALQGLRAELGTIDTLKTDVAVFCAAVAELEANASPQAKGNAKQDAPASTEEQQATTKKPKRPPSRLPCISWSPWDEAAPVKAKAAK